jgi:hypothetical protein
LSSESTAPDTIVLVHGFWVTPRSWEHWITRYEQRGYRVNVEHLGGAHEVEDLGPVVREERDGPHLTSAVVGG